MTEIYKRQPAANAAQVWNRVEYRPLEGFVYALTPFNFTSISGNLPTAPAVMGNTVVWKPASSAVLSNYYVMKLLQEAGLPDGVINFIPGDGAQIGPTVFNDPRFAGMHFTGSTATFRSIWLEVAENLSKGVQVRLVDDQLDVDLFIVVEYGISVAEVCKTIVEVVKYKLESMTGVKVRRVNISVEGIRV